MKNFKGFIKYKDKEFRFLDLGPDKFGRLARLTYGNVLYEFHMKDEKDRDSISLACEEIYNIINSL